MSERRTNLIALDFLVLGLTLSAISIIIPTFFEGYITISPLVLFGIIFFANISNYLIPDTHSDRIFSLRFFTRLAIGGIFAYILILIPVVARSLA